MMSKINLTQVKLIILFNIICIASIIFGILFNQHVELHSYRATVVYKQVLGYSIVPVVMIYIIDNKRKIAHFLVVMVSTLLLITLINLDKISQIERGGYLKGGYFLGDGNDFALGVNIVIPFAFFFLGKTQKVRTRIIFFAATLLLILGVIFSQSRGAILGLSIVLLFFAWTSKYRIRSMVIVTIAFTIAISMFSTTYLARMNTISNYQQDGSATGRISAWKASVGMMKDRPLLGIGLGNFAWAYGLHYKPSYEIRMTWRTAHSIYFLLLGELGFLGLVCYLAIMYSNLKAARMMYKSKQTTSYLNNSFDVEYLGKCLFASQLSYAVSGAFLSAAYYPHFFIITGIIASSYNVVLLNEME